ncbi:MAG: hypothetical protein PHX20_04665, partial [Candidatus Omnitrophica bacterium]|nr:hypothetical protein [Candidatus Omnitrophota bacterium]
MIKKSIMIFIALTLCALPQVSARSAAESTELTCRPSFSDYNFPGLAKKISLDIRGMDIVQFLKFLAAEGSLNIVTSKNVTGNITLIITDVTIGDALEIALSMNNLASEVKGSVISIMTNAEYKAKYDVDFYDQRKT